MSEKTTKTQEELEREAYEKALKENPPKEITELLSQPGEVIFKGLSDADKFQVLARYLNEFGAYFGTITQVFNGVYLMLRALCEHEGIDLAAEQKKIQKRIQEQKDKAVKEELEKYKA